ncbi:MAG: hypothetical protein ACM3KL_04890, partial [Alphaproteobacteria bacterium]
MRTLTVFRIWLVLGLVACGGSSVVAEEPAQGSGASTVVTGEHRGFTNNKLYLKLDDGTELTLVVEIPGDKDEKWHTEFETLSRITVTYHKNAEGKLVVTSIKKAD